MRLVTCALCLLIAGPAVAAPSAGLRVLGSNSVSAGLRGAQAAPNLSAPAALPPPIQSKAPLSFFASDAQPAARDLEECRRSCARDYYFCLAGEDAPSCPQNWTRCRSDCSRDSHPLP
jgi:hypothetical protein